MEPLQDFSETDSSPYYNAVMMAEEGLSSRLGDANWPLKSAVTRHTSLELAGGCGMNEVIRSERVEASLLWRSQPELLSA